MRFLSLCFIWEFFNKTSQASHDPSFRSMPKKNFFDELSNFRFFFWNSLCYDLKKVLEIDLSHILPKSAQKHVFLNDFQ